MKGLNFVHNHSNKEVAKVILNQFPDTSLSDLEKAVKNIEKLKHGQKIQHLQKNHLIIYKIL